MIVQQSPRAVRAFVTGIGGQDGSYLAEQLLAAGAEVHALDHRAAPGHDAREPDLCPAAVERHEGDLTDVEGVRRLLLSLAPTHVFNLAALSSVALSWTDPDRTAAVNGLGAVGLMESAYRVQQQTGDRVHFVQASSAEMFGNAAVVPQDEATPLRPVNPYGAAKAYAHLMVGVYRQRGLHSCGMVLYNHESPRRPARFVTRRITSGVAAIARGERDRLTLGNLEARRDWGWAPDYVDALIRAADSPEPDDYVIATGESHSVREFVAAAFAAVGISDWAGLVEVDESLLRPADPHELRGDATRARERLGWAPTVGFAEIVARMVDADR